ncbi:MAG: glutamate racemase [Methylacidiphilales bacterium]|nr:glutamate racemase [Candidatus Methylacidiphilales bacterium]
MDDRPLGIFDSGLGGLTVARALREVMPGESLIYLGDTARVPYGNKSSETIIRYSRENSRFLLSRDVKAVVVACNTASAYALETLRVELKTPVFGVIEAGVEAALKATKNNRVGIMGTSGTIRSSAYQDALKAKRPDIQLVAEATPLLVPLIEEDWLDHAATRSILEEYLWKFRRAGVDTLVLACTHYPLLKPTLLDMLGPSVELVDSARTCADYVRRELEQSGSLSAQPGGAGMEVYLTDQPAQFTRLAERFLKQKLEHVEVISVDGTHF